MNIIVCDCPCLLSVVNSAEGPEVTTTTLKSMRPPVGNIDPSVDSITFQQIDMDYYVGEL